VISIYKTMANDEIIKPPISEISQATQGITEQGIIKLLGLDPALKVEFKNEGNRVFLKISSQTNSYPKTEAGLQYVDKLQDYGFQISQSGLARVIMT
jgi:hypothetical protein